MLYRDKMTTTKNIRSYANNQIIKAYTDKSEKYKGFKPKKQARFFELEKYETLLFPFQYQPYTLAEKEKAEQLIKDRITSIVEIAKNPIFVEKEFFFKRNPFRCRGVVIPDKEIYDLLKNASLYRLTYESNRDENIIGFSIDKDNLDFELPASKIYRTLPAKRVGLKYTYAHLECPDIDPIAFKIWEEISQDSTSEIRRNGKTFVRKGAWDSCGVYGMSPNMIRTIWFKCGCYDSHKYRSILKFLYGISKKYRFDDFPRLDKIRKSASADETIAYLKGQLFYRRWGKGVKTQGTYPDGELCESYYFRHVSLKYKDYVRIGKVKSLPVRIAMISDMELYQANDITFGQLNFKYASKVQAMSKAEQAKLLPSRAAWYFLYGRCPFDAPGKANKDIPNPNLLARWKKGASTFTKLCNTFGKAESMLLPNFNLVALFGSESEMLKFIHLQYPDTKSHKNISELYGYNIIHDLGQFSLPKGEFSTAWKDFVMKYPEALKYSSNWINVEKELGRIPKSLTELRNTVAEFTFENVRNKACAVACFEAKVSQDTFEAYQRLYENTKVAESCPQVEVSLNGFTFRKLDYNDPKGALLGLFTNCCQHLNGAAASCARHGVQDESSAFYVVEKAGKIIAQSWAWRSKKGDLVFDSIESLSSDYADAIAGLYQKASVKLLGRLGIKRVLVGYTSYGITSTIKHKCQIGAETYQEQMVSPCNYMDGSQQWLIAETGEEPEKLKKKFLKPTIKPEKTELSINTLLSGSDVYCEYCDAEVHPDCEICPSCNANIAEWV